MRPVRPKYKDKVKVEWHISRESRLIISEYSKYTKFEEEELIEKAIHEIMEDQDFVIWLQSKRNQKRVLGLIEEAKIPEGFVLDIVGAKSNEGPKKTSSTK